MELFDELLLSFITVLFALLMAKIASSVADRRRAPSCADRSVELEELGRRQERSEQVLASAGALEEEFDDCSLEIEKADAKSEEEKRSESLDVAREEPAKELDDEDRKRHRASDLRTEELGEAVKIGQDDEKKSLTVEEGCKKDKIDEKVGSLLHGEDEWEGIEKSELETLFARAMEYVGSVGGGRALSKLSSDDQMQFYGLRKVATQGPCYEPQPLALRVTARAKWHSWQRLGSMDPQAAMEQYIALLSERIPGWMGNQPEVHAEKDRYNYTPDVGASRTEVSDLGSFPNSKPTSSVSQRIFEDSSSAAEVDEPTTSLKGFEKGKNLSFVFSLLSPARVAFLAFYW